MFRGLKPSYVHGFEVQVYYKLGFPRGVTFHPEVLGGVMVAPTANFLAALAFAHRWVVHESRQRQTLFFTATWPMSVRKLAAEYRGLNRLVLMEDFYNGVIYKVDPYDRCKWSYINPYKEGLSSFAHLLFLRPFIRVITYLQLIGAPL